MIELHLKALETLLMIGGLCNMLFNIFTDNNAS